MSTKTKPSSHWQAATARNTVSLAFWTFAWVAMTALAAFGPKFIWDYHVALTVLGVLLNVSVGIGMIMANARHLRGLDEMQQKIFLDACALTLGVGLVFGCGYELLEDIRLISFEPEISHLIILMGLTFVASTLAGHRKYR